MKISLNWLKEYIEVPFTPKELDYRLTMLGIEVEKIENWSERYAKIVVGEVLEEKKHPNADKLHLTKVSIGSGEPLQIVCGAPNCRAGLKVAVATIGADLGEGFIIKKSKLRGEVSEGMLCSERELGLSENHDGILELPPDSKVGAPLAEALGKDDAILEIGITPNRPDCLSHIGIAREIAAITDYKVKIPTLVVNESGIPGNAKVTVMDSALCPRYAGRLVRNVNVAPSPEWLKRKIEAVGLRSINNIVDITNFVLMECGHPLHAFDFSKIKDGHVIIRRAKDFAKEFTTLDGKRRSLDPETLLIGDSEKPLAIAGIMGGENSEISNSATDVFIESAYFLPQSIRKSAKRLALSTDASYRFERGTDIDNVLYALDRATELIVELAGGRPAGKRIDVYPSPTLPKQFRFRPERAEKLIGLKIKRVKMRDIFKSLNIGIEELSELEWNLTPPSYRIDLEVEEDATEELARVIGYTEIPQSSFERAPFPMKRDVLSHRALESEIRSYLLGAGLNECVSSPLIAAEEAEWFNASPVAVVNPLNEEMNRLRTSIAPNLIETARRNERFGANSVRLFEMGNVFGYSAQKQQIGNVAERIEVGMLMMGVAEPKSPYNTADVRADIFHIRAIAEQLLKRLGVRDLEVEPLSAITSASPWAKASEMFESDFTVGIQTEGLLLGIVGKISAPLAKHYELRSDAYVALVDYAPLFGLLVKERTAPRKVVPLPKYPTVERDLALVLSEHISASELLRTIKANVDAALLERLSIFDEFRSPEMKARGERSLAVRLVIRSKEKTLGDEEVDALITSVVAALQSKFEAKLRQ